MKFKSCLLACDIDGTLMNEGYINPKNIEYINKFVDEGGIFCLATGRCGPALNHIIPYFEKSKIAIIYNGGMIYDFKEEKVLYEKTLDNSDKLFFKNVLDNTQELGIEVHTGKEIYWLRKSKGSQEHLDYEYLTAKETDFDHIKNLPWNKAMCVFDNCEQKIHIEKMAKEFNSKSCSFVNITFKAFGKNYCGFEQLPLYADKGTALRELRKILNIPKGKIFAIGDYYNDVAMLRAADVSACTIDSPEDIKKSVDFVAGTCLDGAVADFIEYLMTVDL